MDQNPPYLNLVVIRSPDIERAAAFYRSLGLTLERHAHGSGPQHYSSESNGSVFEIYPSTPKSLPTTATRIGFRVKEMDEVVKFLSSIGAKILAEPTDTEWGRRAVLTDPDGHVVELIACRRNLR